jgi:RHS repeat-associated protein
VRIDELLTYQRKETDNSWTGFYATQGRHDSVVALRQADAGGTLVERVEYDPYGKASVFVGASTTPQAASSVGNPYLYAGRRMDEETGYLYLRNRYLHTGWGRFLTNDPIGNWGDGGNLGNGVAFVGNSPGIGADALGLMTVLPGGGSYDGIEYDAKGKKVKKDKGPPKEDDAQGGEEDSEDTCASDGEAGQDPQDPKAPKSDRKKLEEAFAHLQTLAGTALGSAGAMAAGGNYQGAYDALTSFPDEEVIDLANQAYASGYEDIGDASVQLGITVNNTQIQLLDMRSDQMAARDQTIRGVGLAMTGVALVGLGVVAAVPVATAGGGSVLFTRCTGGCSAARGANTAYEAALAGGKHAGTLRNYAGRPAAEIQKAIRSYERQVALHGEKIANPAQFAERCGQMSAQEQSGFLNKWAADAARNQELADVLRGLLGSR